MLRFAVAPDASLIFDVGSVLPGRGIWLSASADALALACKRRAFDRAARRTVLVPADLAGQIEARLAARCCDAIGLARRSGIAVAGYEKVFAALKGGRQGVTFIASDAAVWARKKLFSAAVGVPIIGVLTSTELAGVFGRDKTVHAFVGRGALAERLQCDAARLAGFRPCDVASVTERGDTL